MIRSVRQRTLLAALVVARPSVLSTDRLTEILWAADQPREPEQALQSQVSRLRRKLADAGGDAAREILTTHPAGYRLELDDDQVDAGRFEQLSDEAETTPDLAPAVELADAALALWRGPPLVEFDQPFARTEASRLEQLRVRLITVRADAMLGLGRPHDVVEDLEPAVAAYPFDEALHGRMMVALYRCGRQADALTIHRELRARLADELGLEPSAQLRDLERDILQQREGLGGPARLSVGGSPRDGDVPHEPTSFVGREEDVADVAAALQDAPLVTLVGPGGVGKTRLAMRVARTAAHDRRGGLTLCDLSTVSDATQVVEAVATTLKIQHRGQDTLLEAVVSVLRHQDSLVLLDNCEHVLDGVVPMAEEILRICPQVLLLATSRVPLAVAGEQVWPVAPLAVDAGVGVAPAVALFRDRAHAVDATLDMRDLERSADVRELCRRLDGLPLAIELAAARIRSMTPADMLGLLQERLHLPGAARRTGPERHRTLHAVAEWSYDLLSPSARRLFDRLSVFTGGFTREAAEAVCSGEGLDTADVAVALAELVDHSLVLTDRSHGHARHQLLETLRLFGLEQLGDAAPRWFGRHADHFLHVAERAESMIRGNGVASGVRLVDAELANLRAAHRHATTQGEATVALHLPSLLHHYAVFRIRDEVFRWVEAGLDLPEATTHSQRDMAQAVAAAGCAHRGELERGSRLAYEARQRTSDDRVRLRVLGALCEIAIFRRRLAELGEMSHQMAELAHAAGQPHDEGFAHLFAGFGAMFADRADDALEHVRRGRDVADGLGNADLRAALTFLEGQVLWATQPEQARPVLQAAIELAGSVDNRFIAGIIRVSLAELEAHHGDTTHALQLARDVIVQYRTAGLWTHLWATLRKLLELFQRVGADEATAVLHGVIQRAGASEVAFGVDAERRAQTLASLRSTTGATAVAAAQARGRAMDRDEAVAWVLATLDDLVPDVTHVPS